MSAFVAGCADQGFSIRDDEWQRNRAAGPFDVISINHERAVVTARGRQVAIEAAEGFCLAKESIETTGRSAFAMIGDCVLDDPQAVNSLPQGVPGIITVSISGDRGYTRDGEGAGSLSDLSDFLKTAEGRKMLGRGGAGNSVSIKESRTINNGLYVLVEDKNTDLVPILAPRFWRSFVDLNDRLTVVTISSFRDKPLRNDEMLKYLVNQVKTLTTANRYPINEAKTLVADAGGSSQDTENIIQALADLQPEALTVTAETVLEDLFSPVPPSRPEAVAAVESDEVSQSDGEVLEAPEETDPAIILEIAAATEAIPIPTPRGGVQATATQEQNAAQVPDAAPEPSTAEDVPATETASVDAQTPEETETAEKTASSEAASADSAAPDAATQDTAAIDAAAIAEPSVEEQSRDQETVATTTEGAGPEPAAATANAPKNAPQAPRRPKRG